MATLHIPRFEDDEKPMQTAAGRRMSRMPETVTGTNNVKRAEAMNDRAINRGSDSVFGPDEREWTAAELANPMVWYADRMLKEVALYPSATIVKRRLAAGE